MPETVGQLQYVVVTGAAGAGFNASVAAQVTAGYAPIGVPYVNSTSGNLEQVLFRGAATSFIAEYAITAVASGIAGTGSFTIAGNQTKDFRPGFRFTVTGSTGNDGTYTVRSSTFGASTVLAVREAVPNAVADGNVISYAA